MELKDFGAEEIECEGPSGMGYVQGHQRCSGKAGVEEGQTQNPAKRDRFSAQTEG